MTRKSKSSAAKSGSRIGKPRRPRISRDDGEVTGQTLIDMLQASPHRDVEIASPRALAPVRNVVL